MKLGYKITKIHKILIFDEKPFLKEYIDLNSNLRKQANKGWSHIAPFSRLYLVKL